MRQVIALSALLLHISTSQSADPRECDYKRFIDNDWPDQSECLETTALGLLERSFEAAVDKSCMSGPLSGASPLPVSVVRYLSNYSHNIFDDEYLFFTSQFSQISTSVVSTNLNDSSDPNCSSISGASEALRGRLDCMVDDLSSSTRSIDADWGDLLTIHPEFVLVTDIADLSSQVVSLRKRRNIRADIADCFKRHSSRVIIIKGTILNKLPDRVTSQPYKEGFSIWKYYHQESQKTKNSQLIGPYGAILHTLPVLLVLEVQGSNLGSGMYSTDLPAGYHGVYDLIAIVGLLGAGFKSDYPVMALSNSSLNVQVLGIGVPFNVIDNIDDLFFDLPDPESLSVSLSSQISPLASYVDVDYRTLLEYGQYPVNHILPVTGIPLSACESGWSWQAMLSEQNEVSGDEQPVAVPTAWKDDTCQFYIEEPKTEGENFSANLLYLPFMYADIQQEISKAVTFNAASTSQPDLVYVPGGSLNGDPTNRAHRIDIQYDRLDSYSIEDIEPSSKSIPHACAEDWVVQVDDESFRVVEKTDSYSTVQFNTSIFTRDGTAPVFSAPCDTKFKIKIIPKKGVGVSIVKSVSIRVLPKPQ